MHPTRADGGLAMVYFIQAECGGSIKIGLAKDPATRLNQIQRYSPLRLRIIALMDGDRSAELALHRRFLECWSHGEWFTPTPELIRWIHDHAAPITIEAAPATLRALFRLKREPRQEGSRSSRVILGNAIRTARKTRRMNQSDLGYLIGVRQRRITEWENALTYPRTTYISRLLEALPELSCILLPNGDNVTASTHQRASQAATGSKASSTPTP